MSEKSTPMDELEAIGWKQVSKSSTEAADKPDVVRTTIVYQAQNAHACPICGYAHAPNIQAATDIAVDAKPEESRAKFDGLKSDAIKHMLTINNRVFQIAQIIQQSQKPQKEENKDERAGTERNDTE